MWSGLKVSEVNPDLFSLLGSCRTATESVEPVRCLRRELRTPVLVGATALDENIVIRKGSCAYAVVRAPENDRGWRDSEVMKCRL